jgi:hypothetical protein
MAIRYGSDIPPAPDRLAKARAALSGASDRVGAAVAVPPKAHRDIEWSEPRKAAPEPVGKPVRGFDRAAWHKAYQKAYMKTYMQAYRARKKADERA